jgi:hypothetical protein
MTRSYTPSQIADAILAGEITRDSEFVPLAEVARQARHIEELRSKIDAEKSCACSFDAPGDVCATHSPSLMEARSKVERLREVLIEWDALIKHQFTGSREAMSDMQVAVFRTKQILDELDAPRDLEAKRGCSKS